MTDLASVKETLRAQRIETPSWGYGNSGTRFKVFPQEGVPRTPQEKIDDAAMVHRFTGVAPTVALHIPWDRVDDYAELAKYAAEQGVALGAINANVFQDDDYKLGSVTQPRPARAPQGDRPPAGVRRRHGRRPGRATSSSGSPTAPTTPARTTSAPARTGSPRRCARSTTGSATTSGWCWSTSCSSPPSTPRTCRTGARRTRTASSSGRAGAGGHRHRPPRAGHEHRVHRRVPAARRAARGVRLQLPVLRRRRPDGRRGRPVPAVPDHARDRAGRRAATGRRGSRSCSTSATTSRPKIPADHPVGDERPGGHRQGAARGRGGAGGRAARGRRAGARTPCSWTPTTPTSGRCWRRSATDAGLDPDPSAAYHRSGYFERDPHRARRAASRPAGAPETPPPTDRPGTDIHDPARDHPRVRSSSPAATAWAPTRATPTTPAATPRPRARPPTRSPARRSSCCGSRAPAATSAPSPRQGLAVLRLDRLRALVDVYPGVEREDEMVAAFDYCLHGRGGAAPSIDTAMHGLVDAAHVDHLHPDAGHRPGHGGRRRGAHQGELRRPGACGCRGGAPGSSSAWTSPRSTAPTRRRSGSSSAATASPPGARPARSARRTRWRSSAPPQRFIDEHGRAEPFGAAAARVRAAAARTSAAPGPPRSRR